MMLLEGAGAVGKVGQVGGAPPSAIVPSLLPESLEPPLEPLPPLLDVPPELELPPPPSACAAPELLPLLFDPDELPGESPLPWSGEVPHALASTNNVDIHRM
jgi:hypothetical protein